jgi:mono/diheme cytochrome c family protein
MRYALLLAVLAIAFYAFPSAPAMSSKAHNSSARSAAELYAKHCASCHGKDGRAKTFKAKLITRATLPIPSGSAM